MKQIITHEQCTRCRECCRFREDRQYFAPLFTDEEIEQIAATRAEMPTFTPYNESGTVQQIRLVRSQQQDTDYPYVCPFLDEDNYRCTIYEVRPFDCRVWPMLLHRRAGRPEVQLSHYHGDVCLALAEASEADLDAYKKAYKTLLHSESFQQFLRQYPDLIWEHEDNDTYQVIPLASITINPADATD